jgi:hypothetical protein
MRVQKCGARPASYVDPEGKGRSFIVPYKPRARVGQWWVGLS